MNYDYETKLIDINSLNLDFSSYVLGVDIGGTYTNFGIAGIKNKKPILLFSLKFTSKELESLTPAIIQTLNYAKNEHNIDVYDACIGAAGVVSPTKNFADLTNVNWNVSTNEIIKNTSLKNAFIINDFQAIGYGINLLDHSNKNDIFQVRPETNKKYITHQNRAIIGAGTGFGKCILFYDHHLKAYIPNSSEGGHGDFPIYDDFEQRLINFIEKEKKDSFPVCYEDVLSGNGIESIYNFLTQYKKYQPSEYQNLIKNSIEKASLISKYGKIDELCKETFQYFTKFYGRCAKNFVLDTLATGGLYIAGGIASKNSDIFQTDEFLFEFENSQKRKGVLRKIPIYVIMNYDVSLYGTCFAAMYKKTNK